MKKPRAALLAPLVCLLPFLGWWVYGLFDLDEGFYASVVAEMNRRGEWVTPFFDGKPWFEKPILLYWVAKPCLMVFGGEFGIRLPSILACLVTCGLVLWFGKRRLGLDSGPIAAMILATSIIFVVIGRMVLVDPILVACLTGAFVTFWESLVGDKRWRLVCAACLGAAILAKGPVSGVFFIAVAGYTYWREKELRAAFRGQWFWGTLILLAFVASWYVPAYLVNGHLFVQKFLIEQNLERFKGGDEAHAVPMPFGLVYYIPVVLVGMVPWSLFIPKAWPRRNEGTLEAPLRRYLATWSAVVFLFFTISGTKLPTYVLPAFPPLALLVGHLMASRWGQISRARYAGFAIAGFGIAGLLTFGFNAYWRASQIDGRALAAFIGPESMRSAPVLVQSNAVQFRLTRGGEYPNLPKPDMFGIKIGVNETSAPSLYFYLAPFIKPTVDATKPLTGINWPVLETDKLSDLPRSGKVWILTRPGRLSDSEKAQLSAEGLVLQRTLFNPNGLTVCYQYFGGR